MGRPLMKVAAGADYLGIGTTAMRAEISSGVIPACRIGPGQRSLRLRPEDLDSYVETRMERARDEVRGSEATYPVPLRSPSGSSNRESA